MSDSPERIQWHPAFYAATNLEFREDIEYLERKTEYNLSKEPIRIDLLIIKDDALSHGIKNEIGHIMRKYNVIEYKSPEDSLNIDDYYKTVGYACLYKGYGKTSDAVPSDQITVSLFREKYPNKLFEKLKEEGHKIEEKYPGIYYINDNVTFPTQVVVTSQLSKQAHSSLRVLSANAEREDIEHFLNESAGIKTQQGRNDINAVLNASARANMEVYEEIRRGRGMSCEALRELFKDELEEAYSNGEERGETRGKGVAQKEIILNMNKNNFTIQQISQATNISVEDIEKIINQGGQ